MENQDKKVSSMQDAREEAFKILFQSYLYDDMEELFGYLLQERPEMESNMEYIRKIVLGCIDKQEYIDKVISESLDEGTDKESISRVLLTILRLSVYEMLYAEDMSEKDAADAGVDLTVKYGYEEDVGFVYVVLERMVNRHNEAEKIIYKNLNKKSVRFSKETKNALKFAIYQIMYSHDLTEQNIIDETTEYVKNCDGEKNAKSANYILSKVYKIQRRNIRDEIFKLIFQSSSHTEETGEMFVYLLREKPEMKKYIERIKSIVIGCIDKQSELDEIISENINTNWKISRIAKVPLNILRLAVYEMKYVDDIPNKVAINEAVELAKKYADEKNAKFVNGVLSGVYRQIHG